ncbi:MAG: VanZ family protein [Oscillospiraceae bacterium]|nr:VanZ family protein [Oscillospiraceae bacterium]MCR4761689.1 VanZ family protein [Oscillospiraceae bacterium]
MRKNPKASLWLCTLLTVLWMCLIFWFSSRDATESGNLSGSLLHGLLGLFWPGWKLKSAAEQQQIFDSLHIVLRKCGHFTEFAVLGILLRLNLLQIPKLHMSRRQKPSFGTGFALPALLALLYACTDEFHQRFVPGRSCELRDVCIDFGGACTGLLLWAAAAALFRQIRNSVQRKKTVS